jgi:predicted NAD-dependent protein-ADP-ribosyltransferase YbiA (DUF1768 family)
LVNPKPIITKKKQDKTKTKKIPKDTEDNEKIPEDDNVNIKGKLKTTKKKKPKKESKLINDGVERQLIKDIPQIIRGKYTDTILFCIYDKAPDEVPGKGKYEKIPDSSIDSFKTLETYKDWRSRLSNTHQSVFTLDNHKWNSVFHYYVACQFKLSNPEFYLSFSIDSGSVISRSIAKAREASDMSKDSVLRNKEIVSDPDYYNSTRHLEELFYGTQANIEQHEDLKRILVNTRDAKLMRYVKKDDISKFVIDSDLIYIRYLLNEKEKEVISKKNEEKIGGGVRFGMNQIKYFDGDKEDNKEDNEYTDDDEPLVLGGELDNDVLNLQDI